jgi:tetratricopeptide (TPR) repeat protein
MSPSSRNEQDLLARASQMKEAGRYRDAIDLIEEIILQEPENIRAFEELADAELSEGNYERADTAASRAIALAPDHFSAHYVRGIVAGIGEDWDASLAFLRQANALEQNHPEILRCLGWSLFNAGKSVEGVVTLERALNLDEGNPLILCDLGVVYLRLEEFEKSKSLLRRALDQDPSNDRVKECLDIVRRMERKSPV